MIELSEAECVSIVRRATKAVNVEIKHFSVENFGTYLGFLGEYFRLKIDADVCGVPEEFNLFLKSLPSYDLKQRKMLIETGIFRKETRLYDGLLTELRMLTPDAGDDSWCPAAYLCRDDLLVLDDMALKGFKILPTEVEFSRSHVEVTLQTLARFHAASFVHEGRGKSIPGEFGELLFETSVDDIPWFHSGLQVGLSTFPLA